MLAARKRAISPASTHSVSQSQRTSLVADALASQIPFAGIYRVKLVSRNSANTLERLHCWRLLFACVDKFRRSKQLPNTMTRLFAGTQFDRPPRCEVCDRLEADCDCPPPTPEGPLRIAPEKQTARLSVEKRRKGKMVTVVRNLDPDGNDLPELLTRLKTSCGAGGSIQDAAIEIQGKHIDRIKAELQKIGYKVSGS